MQLWHGELTHWPLGDFDEILEKLTLVIGG